MVDEMIKRERISIEDTFQGPIVFLYRNRIGRFFLKIVTLPTISKIAGWFMDKKISAFAIDCKVFLLHNRIKKGGERLETHPISKDARYGL